MVEHILIRDKTTKKILVSGNVCKYKYHNGNRYLSIDEIYFFNESSDRFTIYKNYVDLYIPFDKTVLNNYICCKWMDKDTLFKLYNIDIILENEYDKECVKLIDALNRIDGVTTILSCSGHGVKPFTIDIQISNLQSLIFLQSILPCKYFRLTTDRHLKYCNDKVVFSLQSYRDYDSDTIYSIADQFADTIVDKLTHV